MFVPIRCCFSISTISQWFNIYHQEDYGFMFKMNRAREHQLSPEYLIFFFSRSLCFFLLLLLYMYIILCKILFHLTITRAEGGLSRLRHGEIVRTSATQYSAHTIIVLRCGFRNLFYPSFLRRLHKRRQSLSGCQWLW